MYNQLELSFYSRYEKVFEKSASQPIYDESLELSPYSRKLLEILGIKLYKHQADAIRVFLEGKNVGVVTPTASGKTLPYVISYLEEVYRDPNAVALYIAPINALINDQAEKIANYIRKVLPQINVFTFTSATDSRERAFIKSSGSFVLTNPEMLVYSLILYNDNWKRFWKSLKLIIVDEIHEMSGLKGTHFGNLIRVVNMLNDIYVNNARYFALSGTVGNPEAFLEAIFDRKFEVIKESTAGSKKIECFIPNLEYAKLGYSGNSKVLDLLKTFIIGADKKVLTFVKSRKAVERLAKIIKGSSLSNKVMPYRSGYDPRDRKGIENMFKTGKIKGLIATSAFEMGIDIGDLDVVCILGFPLSRISFRQRLGRTGRVRDGVVVFIPTQNALDNYYYNHPEELFSDEVEDLAANVYNERVIGYYIALAVLAYNEAFEVSGRNFISSDVVAKYWGEEGVYRAEKFIEYERKTLGKEEILSSGPDYYNPGGRIFITKLSKNDIRELINLRNIGRSLDIVLYDEDGIKKRIGEISLTNLFYEAHPGGVYLHMGESYFVENVDLEDYTISVRKGKINLRRDYSDVSENVDDRELMTEILVDKDIQVLNTMKKKFFRDSSGNNIFSLSYCRFLVKEIFKGFIEYELRSVVEFGVRTYKRFVKDIKYYDVPYELSFETEGIMIKFDGAYLRRIVDFEKDKHILLGNASLENYKINEESILNSGLHAAEHAIIGMYPSEIICSRMELGGFSSVNAYGAPTIFIYESVEGGVGYSEVAYYKMDKIVKRAFSTISECSCSNDGGCPSCIQSPKCGNANMILSKHMGRKVLGFLMEGFKNDSYEEEKKNGDVRSPKVVEYSISFLKKDLPSQEGNGKYAFYDLLKYPLENFKKPLVFDLESQYYSYEVGGWNKARDMLMSIGVVYDIKEDKYFVFSEDSVKALIDMLFSSDIVIGYNIRNFDYKVLSRYDSRFEVADNVKTFDILNDLLKKHVGDMRISLHNLIQNNINGIGKRTQSEKMPLYFREGKVDVVIEHCKEDVYFTYLILKKVLEDRYLEFEYGRKKFRVDFEEVVFRFKL